MLSSAVLTLALLAAPPPPSTGYLYRATLLQAAPGKLLEVVDLYKAGWPGLRDSGDEAPVAMRHSQGDRWDLLLLFPMGGFEQFYAHDRVLRREKAASAARADLERLRSDLSRQEDVFVLGPPLEEVRGKLGDSSTSRCSRRCPACAAGSTGSARWRTRTRRRSGSRRT